MQTINAPLLGASGTPEDARRGQIAAAGGSLTKKKKIIKSKKKRKKYI